MDIIRDARLTDGTRTDIGLLDGLICAIGPNLGPGFDARGRMICGGLIETHIHLDKSRITDRCDCGGGLQAAITSVRAAKRAFTEEDVYRRARDTLERAIAHGTMHLRTHVEVDPRIGLTSVHALLRLKQEYAWAVDLELCCFPQEGLIDDPGCEDVLVTALEAGCDLIGGAPYMDRDPNAQIARLFALARRFDVDIDLHLDNTVEGKGLDLIKVCRLTKESGWGGRVTIGHATKLSTLPPGRLEKTARLLAETGVAVTVLPATDLFIMGAGMTHDVLRGVAPARVLSDQGVTCSLSTNNVLNPFTPFGDASLLRIANLFANVAQIGDPAGLATCFEMITTQAAKLMRRDYGITIGMPADLVLLDCSTPSQAVAEIAPALAGWKRGIQTFERSGPRLFYPISSV